MGIYDDFPTRNKILRVKDIEMIKQLVYKIDTAFENKRDILKRLDGDGSYFPNTNAIDNVCGGVIVGPTRISECMDRDAAARLTKDFQEQILKEIDKFIQKNIDILKKEYSVLYETKDQRGNWSY